MLQSGIGGGYGELAMHVCTCTLYRHSFMESV